MSNSLDGIIKGIERRLSRQYPKLNKLHGLDRREISTLLRPNMPQWEVELIETEVLRRKFLDSVRESLNVPYPEPGPGFPLEELPQLYRSGYNDTLALKSEFPLDRFRETIENAIKNSTGEFYNGLIGAWDGRVMHRADPTVQAVFHWQNDRFEPTRALTPEQKREVFEKGEEELKEWMLDHL